MLTQDEQVLSILSDRRGYLARDIARAVNIPTKRVSLVLWRLKRKGLIDHNCNSTWAINSSTGSYAADSAGRRPQPVFVVSEDDVTPQPRSGDCEHIWTCLEIACSHGWPRWTCQFCVHYDGSDG